MESRRTTSCDENKCGERAADLAVGPSRLAGQGARGDGLAGRRPARARALGLRG